MVASFPFSCAVVLAFHVWVFAVVMGSSFVLSLRLLSWNVQGLGDKDKCGVVKNSVCSMDPSFVCLQETKLAQLDSRKAVSYLLGRLSQFVAKLANGSRGGVLTAWDPSSFSLVSSLESAFSLTVTLACASTGNVSR